MSEQLTKEEVEQMSKDIVRGLERTLGDLGPKLVDQVDNLSTKQLRRALKASINFIYKADDKIDESALKQEELRFIGEMFALIETGKQYTLNIIAELQKEREERERQGEENE